MSNLKIFDFYDNQLTSLEGFPKLLNLEKISRKDKILNNVINEHIVNTYDVIIQNYQNASPI